MRRRRRSTPPKRAERGLMTGAALPPLRDVIARHGLMATKALGQHFLLDLNLTARIARAAGDLTTGTCIEVGPGPGGLTRALLSEGAAHVIAIEKDKRCREILEELRAAYPGRLETIEADALAVDASQLGAAPRRIVANLPYNIGTELLLGWLKNITAFESLVLMFQSEVAARLTAPADTKAYGRLSVMTQWLCDVEQLFHVNPKAFTPPPAVNSTVVKLTPHPQPLAPARRETLERVTAAAFGQRRKMLRQSLKSLGVDGEALCREVGIDPTARAEVLSVQEFCALARAVDAR
jgi:16S rRNA (adenine1518-N6/adenine1519-N6)-dimethyltransferase